MAESQSPFVLADEGIRRIVSSRGSGHKATFGIRRPFYIVCTHRDRSKFASWLKEMFRCRFFKSSDLFRVGVGGGRHSDRWEAGKNYIAQFYSTPV
jgi:hypothetical protein